MPLLIDATVGGPTANSYASVADVDAEAPFRGTQGAAWLAPSTTADQKAVACVQATTRLDQLRVRGLRATDVQRLMFPRAGLVTFDGVMLPADTLPDAWKRAHISLSLAYVTAIVAGTDPISGQAVRDPKRVKAGDVEVEYFAPAPGRTGDATAMNDVSDLPADVVRDIAPFLVPDTSSEPYWGAACALRAS